MTVDPVLSILMPVFDERGTVARAVDEALGAELGVAFELVVVDDGSTDGTAEILAGGDWPAGRVRVLRHERNRGKGAAVRSALEAARGEFAAVLDADLEYRAADVALLLRPLLAGDCNAVFGIRALDEYASHSLVYALGNRAVTLATNVLFNVHLRDAMTCQKAIRTDVFRRLDLRSEGFAIEGEITARLLQRGERIVEVPISYRARGSDEGKKLTAVDGARVLGTLLRCRFTR
jgi:glycosyltransferase involved in cell wall biosynthesis